MDEGGWKEKGEKRLTASFTLPQRRCPPELECCSNRTATTIPSLLMALSERRKHTYEGRNGGGVIVDSEEWVGGLGLKGDFRAILDILVWETVKSASNKVEEGPEELENEVHNVLKAQRRVREGNKVLDVEERA